MSMTAVDRLNAALDGRYRIESELGEGGMATVYLANDIKHERKVALKVLKPELAAVVGAERFLAEIKTTANLQHPHILPLFDSGEADSFLFYVMPYVEGESLRDKLNRDHQLPVDDAVRIATNVAEALEYAHSHGVIHRDIKPANILLQAGKPVIADFGIALAVGTAGQGRLTETGLSVGTPHYMSPEQATGDQSVGPATDIYALGAVLYEMLVGEPPYTGSTAQAILGKIIAGKLASATGERASVPSKVDAAIRKALEKIPADRFTDAQGFVRALADPGFTHGKADAVAKGVAVGPWNRLTVAMTVVAALALAWAVMPSTPEARPVARFELMLGEDGAVAPNRVQASSQVRVAISPDGSRLVYVGVAPGGGFQLWERALDDLEPRPISGTATARGAAFSPDGRSVAFWAAGAIKTVSIGDGQPFTVAVEGGGSPAWGPDEMIYFPRGDIIRRAPVTGGESEAWTLPTTGGEHTLPAVLPDGRGLLLTVTRNSEQSRIGVVGPEGGEVREILPGTQARYAAAGHIVYAVAGGTLMAVPFDLECLEVTGDEVALLEGEQFEVGSAAQFALSETGVLLYEADAVARAEELVWVSRTGAVQAVDSASTGEFESPMLSSDGRRLAVSFDEHIFVKQLDRGTSLQVTFEGRNDYPTWMPDGESLTFYSSRAGSIDLWTKPADGSAQAVLQLDRERSVYESLWSPDGEWLLYRTDVNAQGGGDILALRTDPDSDPVPLLATEFEEVSPRLSPDGRWLAYSSDETGQHEVYVRPFPNAGGKWVVSTSGGFWPVWAHSGRELFYLNGEGELVAVQVGTEPTCSPGQSVVLFSAADFQNSRGHAQYDVTPDDDRFIMIRRVGGGTAGRLIVVLNFFEELKRLVPN